MPTPKGGLKTLLISSTLIFGDDKETIANVAIVADVTDFRRMREQMEAQKRLADLGKMSGSVAHEVKNPLAVIDSSALFIESYLATADIKTQEHLKRMKSNVARAANIIQKLVDLSRMKEPELSELDLVELTQSALNQLNMSHDIRVINNVSESEKLRGDPILLHLAVLNVFRNAIEAMGERGALIISSQRQDGHLCLIVQDDGRGIKPEVLPHIFEPLFTTKQGGVGFGLAITKAVIEKHGGHIEVVSSPGAGATFKICLPEKQA